MKRVAFGALVVILGCLVLLVTVEFVLRTTDFRVHDTQQHALHQLRLDRPWIYGLRPGARVTVPDTGDIVYEINSDGFRDRLRSPDPSSDRFRILTMGASITFGWGVELESSFPSRLEKALEARTGERFEVLNLGVNGYNAYNQSALLRDRGLQYKPDLVLVEFCVAGLHDPALHFDAQTRLHFGMIPDEAYPNPEMKREPPLFAVALRACRRFRTCTLLDDVFLSATETRNLAQIIYGLRMRELPVGPERSWLTARYREMAQAAHSIGAGFAVVAFPHAGQVTGELSGLLQEQVVEIGRNEGWPTLDLVPAFRNAASNKDVPPLLLDLWHPSAEGHSIAARETAAWLEREQLLTQSPR